MTNEELDKLYESAENLHDKKDNNHIIPIGTYVGSNQKCRANINKLFGHHCAILGSTGSGKSGTVAALIHSILNHKLPEDKSLNPRIIIIDPHGEYGKAFKDSSIIYKAYSEASNTTSDINELVLPYWLMTGDEFRSLIIGKTEHEATSQNNIVYDALSYARMVNNGIVKTLGSDPDGASPLEMCVGIDESRKYNFDRDKPLPFYLSDFISHIDKVQGRKPGKKEELAQTAGRDKIDGILKKIRVLQSNPQLNFLLNELNVDTPKIHEIIMQLIGEVKDKANKNLRIIDISG
ncbi:MAG: ATP-binding protein, partial [Ignavibacteria bacterium]|nr:ATP-binding protein [Ignavibacteria bacterium]